ncbi:YeiH family protein [Parvibaculum sp.]|uniref:YeiH family protein n=1 Tax=Parvibaculum sp. TaxID=2024848 RepID=UPI000C687681|nr:YeiH family protein [Parvibaculum sp.]MAM93074.1 putative sulfate exporter family transporter [Parvibaculum sp.]HCX69595.1 putative sulfate exporter family transporter [Rhodobiaceae bacterium]|tara:strand:+ start:4873 stop:5985 length:1113 start_codon:yes stop_codon:yes gene_type:complete
MTSHDRGTPRSLKQLESLESMEGIVKAEHSVPSSHSLLHRLPKGALIHAVYPGVLVAVTIALASSWLSQHYGAPVMLFALLFGMAFHFLHEEGRCVAGIEFSSRTILRIGVALLGVRITAGEIASLGVVPVFMVIAGVATTILVGILLSRLLGLKPLFGVLSGGAVAICGASAALAIASVLPQREEGERDTILTVVAITALSTLAMILYPVFVGAIGLDDTRAGIFLGGTIHDVAQVVGAGYMVSVEAGDVATYVKLLRVAMLLPVVFCIAFVVSRTSGGKAAGGARLVPMFLVGFATLVAVNSFGLLSPPVIDAATDVSRWCLVTAIAALGMKTSFGDLASAGWRPVGLMLAETLWIAALVLISVGLLI